MPPVAISYVNSWFPCRCYPEGFAQRLLECFRGRRPMSGHMRHKAAVEMQKTDKDLFANMEIGDPWIDASMVEVWKYLYHSKYLVIPDSWRQPMAEFDQQLTQLATDLQKHVDGRNLAPPGLY